MIVIFNICIINIGQRNYNANKNKGKGYVMEYLYRTNERSLFARFLPLLILILLIMQSFGLHAKKYKETHYSYKPIIKEIIDLTPFNEKRIRLDFDKDGNVLICSQRIMLYPNAFQSADIFCVRAQQIPAKEVVGANAQSLCWKAGNIILCQTTNGNLQLFKPGETKPIEQKSRSSHCDL